MRMLALPAACVLAFALYLPAPQAERALLDAIDALFARFARRFSALGRALAAFVLLLGAAASLLGAVHPIAAALVLTPLFSAPAILPGCARMKDELDSGKYANDIPAYEARVRTACASLAPAFITGAAAPMLLCAIGMPLYIGCGLGWAYFALRQLHPHSRAAQRALVLLLRASDKALSLMMTLCAGVVGRNPLHTGGSDAKSHLMNILGVAGNDADTHDPMAGDIPQGVFLCCFSTGLLCVMLSAVGFVLC